jgi:hypothetical protein
MQSLRVNGTDMAEQIRMPTLFIGGADTKRLLPQVLHALAAPAGFKKRDDSRHQSLDVRAGAATILRNRAGVSGGVKP